MKNIIYIVGLLYIISGTICILDGIFKFNSLKDVVGGFLIIGLGFLTFLSTKIIGDEE